MANPKTASILLIGTRQSLEGAMILEEVPSRTSVQEIWKVTLSTPAKTTVNHRIALFLNRVFHRRVIQKW